MGADRTGDQDVLTRNVPGSSPSKWGRGWAFDLAALILCLAVWFTAWQKMHDLTWPVGWPFLREWLSRPRSMQNPAPLTWVAGELTLQSRRQPAALLIGVRGVLALVGAATLIATWRRGSQVCRHTARAVLAWGLVASLGLGYGYAAQLITLPPFLPSWHFFFYLQALQSVLFGVGVAALGGLLLDRRLEGLVTVLAERPTERQWQGLALAAALLSAFVLKGYSRYAERVDLVDNRKASLDFAADPATKTYDWLLRHTVPSDVVLADGTALFYAVQPAGRKVVAFPELFSNPFVALKPRAADSTRLFADLEAGDESGFRALARKYDVHYVVLAAEKRVTDARKRLLRRVFKSRDRERGWDIYTIKDES